MMESARTNAISAIDILIGADGIAIMTVREGVNWLQWQEPLLDPDTYDYEDGA